MSVSPAQIPSDLSPPESARGSAALPGTRLRYVTSGDGPPLIIIPATVSLIDQWEPLTQFMGLRFSATFFELPGFGGSTPYPDQFQSYLLPGTVEALVDHLGYERFNLMGFSFGGLLALRTLERLEARIDNMVLLAPLITSRALRYSQMQKRFFNWTVQRMRSQRAQQITVKIMHAKPIQPPLIWLLSQISSVDPRIIKNKDALNISQNTLDVFSQTLGEILQTEYRAPRIFSTPCFFAMSKNDDLIHYSLTRKMVEESFKNLKTQTFSHPYHQPPDPPTFQWLVDNFYPFLRLLDQEI